MTRGPRFWIVLVLFQVVFGLAVFSLTRQYYVEDTGNVGDGSVVAEQSEIPASGFPADQDPDVVARLANEAFGSRQYDRAADLYEQLRALRPGNVNVHNNLGITLHYLGRSTEALGVLNEGVSVDPTYQRIWLTLGFVNSQLGNTDEARAALETAAEMDATSDVGQSAIEMLAGLPRSGPPLVGSQ